MCAGLHGLEGKMCAMRQRQEAAARLLPTVVTWELCHLPQETNLKVLLLVQEFLRREHALITTQGPVEVCLAQCV